MAKQPKYTQEQKDYLLSFKDSGLSYEKITNLFNKRFNETKSESAIKQICSKQLGFSTKKYFYYTKEQKDFIINNLIGTPYKKLAEMFNEKFGTKITPRKLLDYSKNNNLHNNENTKKGKTWNKDLSKEDVKKHYTKDSYKKAMQCLKISQQAQEVGSIASCGKLKKRIVLKKTSGNKNDLSRRSIQYDRYIYEQAFGKIPKNSVVIHLNGNENDYNLDNLICVSRNELLQVNKYHCFGKGKITEAMVEIARTQQIINKKCKGE